MSIYPANGELVEAVVVDWITLDGLNPSFVAVDNEERSYFHWLEDDNRWKSSWSEYKGQINLKVILRCGRKEGPRGLTAFMHEIIGYNASEDRVYDDSKTLAQVGKELDSTTKSINEHAPKHIKKKFTKGTKVTEEVKHEVDLAVVQLTQKTRHDWTAPMVIDACICEGRTVSGLLRSRGCDA